MDMEYFDKAADFLPDECFRLPPDLAIVLGSGWGDSLDKDKVLCRIPYADIPGMGATTVVMAQREMGRRLSCSRSDM